MNQYLSDEELDCALELGRYQFGRFKMWDLIQAAKERNRLAEENAALRADNQRLR